MSLISDFKSAWFELFKTSTDPSILIDCGQRFTTSDGREVVLVQNGTVALVAGVLTQHSPIIANHENLAVTAFQAGNPATTTPTTVTITVGATVVNSQQYQNGFVVVNSGTGIGQTLQIADCPGVAASGSLTLTLADNPVVALDVTSTVDLIAQPYTGVVINPTTATATPAAETLYAIPASVANTYNSSGAVLTVGTYQYGWALTRGVTSALNSGGTAVGLALAPSASVAGALATAAATTNQVGSAYQAAVDTQSRAVFINL